MKKVTLLLLLTGSMLFSQETITTKLGAFNAVKVFSGLTVELQKSEISKAVITGKNSDKVSIKNKNGILKLSLSFPEGFKYDDVKIVLYYTDEIAVLDANEGSYISSNEEFEQQSLELKVQEGAHITTPLTVKYLTIKAVSGGVINVVGTTKNQTIEANTGGIYKAFDLKSMQTIATSSAGSVVYVQVSEVLDANVNFGGSIYYKGTPEELRTKKVAGGTIKQKE